MNFEDWFYSRQGESFALRAEYFYEDAHAQESSMRDRLMKEWLKEAFEAGKNSVKTKE